MEVFVGHGDSNIVHPHVLQAYKQLGDGDVLGDYERVGDYALGEGDVIGVAAAVDEMDDFDVNG